MYRWELDKAAQPVVDALRPEIRATLTVFMDAVVIVDPIEYQREFDEPADHPKLLRTPATRWNKPVAARPRVGCTLP